MQEMQKQPLVSIIVITYNSAKFVLETLESAKAQTYRNIELIISDDGSTDNTVQLCKGWIAENAVNFCARQLITSNINLGIPANCNRGLLASKGEWVKFIAGDDALLPNCISTNVEFVENNKSVEILQTNFNQYKDLFLEDNFINRSLLENDEFFANNLMGIDQHKMLLKKNHIAAPSIFLKRALLDKFNGFDEDLTIIEDMPFWLKITKEGVRFYIHNIVTVNYRLHTSSVIRQCKPHMSGQYAKELLLFQYKYMRKEVPFITYSIHRLKYHCIVFLDRVGLNKNSAVINFIYKIVLYGL